MSKICTRCLVDKDESYFQIRKASKDGLTASCKLCLSKYDKERNDLPHRVLLRKQIKESRKNDPIKAAADNNSRIKWISRNTQKRHAHIIVHNAIRSGTIVRPAVCDNCLERGKPDAHHEDYEQPLQIEWLCKKCHGLRHREHNMKDNINETCNNNH